MLDILRWINNFPIRFTIKHYQSFGEWTAELKDHELNSPESWDVLRRAHPHFSIASDREEWLKACAAEVRKDGQDGRLLERAETLAKFLDEHQIASILSVGVGGAGLEYQLKQLKPDLELHCSEFAPETVERLKKVFVECSDIFQFDILKDAWSLTHRNQVTPCLYLFYRVDVHFTDQEWRNIFKKIFEAGIEQILFIPSTCLTIRSLFYRLLRQWKWKRAKQPIAFAGYLRTKKTFQSYWKGFYQSEERMFGGFRGFYLRRISL